MAAGAMAAVFAVVASMEIAKGDAPSAKPAFWLVKDGQPAATIVVASDALKSNRFAAEELQRYLEKITGASLSIATDADPLTGPKILVGRSKLTDALKLDIPTGFTRQLREEGFLIRTVGDVLVVAGNDEVPKRKEDPKDPLSFPNVYTGSLFAVYELLERFGCRWYYPGELGEVVPRSRDLAVPALDVAQRPSFPVRGLWWGVAGAKRGNREFEAEMRTWMLRCRMHPYSSVLASAADGSIMQPFQRWKIEKKDGKTEKSNLLFEEHPAYFAMRKDGSRNPNYLCLAHPEVLKIATDHALDFFRKNPDATCFGYAPPDGAPTCECPDCKRWNFDFMQKPPHNATIQDISEGFYRFLNEVAKAVEKEFPEKWITTTAYSGRIRPPEGTVLNGNVSMHVALLAHSRHHRLDFPSWQTRETLKLYERWAQVSRYAVDRPYYPVMQFHCNIPLPICRANAFNVRMIQKLGMAGSEWEGRASFMVAGLSDYVRARCLWNVETDADALLDEHYRTFYGKAAEPIRRFFDAVEKALTEAPVDHHEEERLTDIYPHDFVTRVTDVGDMEKLVAADDPMTRKRVRFARLVIDHFRSWSDMRHAEQQLDFQRAADLARKMLEQETEIEGLGLTLVDSVGEKYDSSPLYGELGANATARGKLRQYLAKQALLDGTKGELVAGLPVTWQFRTDPRDEGIVHQWFLPGYRAGHWREMNTTQCWEMQGLQDEQCYGYDGFAWYKTTFAVPAQFAGRKIALFLGGLNNQAWVWVNGRLVGAVPHHESWQRWLYHHEVDLTPQVQPGQENSLAIRVLNDEDFGGIFRRCFVYAATGR